jgi:hypothetical protein
VNRVRFSTVGTGMCVDLVRGLVPKSLIETVLVVESEIGLDAGPSLSDRGILFQADLLVFQGTPETFNKDGVVYSWNSGMNSGTSYPLRAKTPCQQLLRSSLQEKETDYLLGHAGRCTEEPLGLVYCNGQPEINKATEVNHAGSTLQLDLVKRAKREAQMT